MITDSPLVGALNVETSNGIPAVGDPYATATEFDTTAVCKTVRAQQDSENPHVWEVRAEYGAPTAEQQQQNPVPTLRPAVLTWGFNKSQRVVWKDKDGKAVTNSAREYFDPPPEMDDSRPTLTISRNEPSFNPAIAINYQDAVNSDSFLGFSPGQVKVAGISATSQTENNTVFWQVTYEFEFRREGWKLSILDQGRNAIFLNPNTQKEFIAPIWQKTRQGEEISNLPVADPVPLDGAGNELANPTPDKVKYRDFDVYKTLPFVTLALP